MRTYRVPLGERELVSLVNPMQALIESASMEVCRVREEAIKSIVESVGIPVDDLTRKLETLSDRRERIEFLRTFLNDHGYHMEIQLGAYQGNLVSDERVQIWKLDKTLQLTSKLMQHKDPFTHVSFSVETTVQEIEQG